MLFNVHVCSSFLIVFFFKQKTAYEMRISDWSSDVCSSDLVIPVDEEKIGYLNWGDHRAFLWMKPGADLTVELDGADGQITFDGQMADANALLEELKLKDTPVFLSGSKRVAVGEMQDGVIRPFMEQLAAHRTTKIGRASGRERVCQYV